MGIYQKYVLDEVDRGIEGRNTGIPLPLGTLASVINNIQQRTYITIGGQAGTGKTGLADFMYVFYPYLWLRKNKDNTDIKLKVIYRSMERSKKYKIQKWTCMYLFMKYNILMDVPTINGWAGKKFNITPEIREKIKEAEEFMEEMLGDGTIDLIDGSINPTGIFNGLVDYARKTGKEEKNELEGKGGHKYSEYSYKADDENLYKIGIYDHLGKLKPESRNGKMFTKKENMDKFSEYLQWTRDLYGFTHIAINQFNRGLESTDRMKIKSLGPESSDWADTSNIIQDVDIALGLYNPYKVKDFSHAGYDVRKFLADSGENRFRSCTVVKNSFGVDDVVVGLNFIGECGYFRELPSSDKIKDYEEFTNNIKF